MRKLLFITLCLAQLGWSAIETKSYYYRPENKEEITLILRDAAPGAHLIFMTTVNRLLVRAEPTDHKTIKRILTELNKPGPRISVSVEFIGSKNVNQKGAYVDQASGRIDKHGISGDLHTDWAGRDLQKKANTTQRLTMQSGREAVLRIGESVPYLDWFIQYGHHYGYCNLNTEYHEIGSFLIVRATTIDKELILMQLTPELRELSGKNPRRIRYQNVTTEAVVANGQTIEIGANKKGNEFLQKLLIGNRRDGVTETLSIRLTASQTTP